jgi:hypothetical protein
MIDMTVRPFSKNLDLPLKIGLIKYDSETVFKKLTISKRDGSAINNNKNIKVKL